MTENKREQICLYFESEITRCKLQEQRLLSDERTDEAIFEKIRMNVFQIFHSVFSVAVKTCGDDDEKIRQFFLSKAEQIPQNWNTSLKKAEEHNDIEKAHIESIKLETICKIKATFEKIWRNTP